MSSSLYSDAINDAKALKEAAEERAKQQLLESMSPKLKKIVESTINQEMGLYESDLDEDDVEECGTYEADEQDEADKMCETDESDSDEEIDLEDNDSKGLKNESYNVLNKVLNSNVLSRNASNVISDFDVKLKHLKESFALASKNRVTDRLIEKIDTQIKELVEESKNIASSDIIKNNNQIKTKFKNSLQELNNMTRRRNSILAENYASLVRGRRLFEEDEVEDMDDMPEDEGEGMDMPDDLDLDSEEGFDEMGGDELSSEDADQLMAIAKKIQANSGGSEEMNMDSEEGEEDEMQEEGWGEATEGMDEMYEVDEAEQCEEDENESHMHAESRRRRFMEARKKKVEEKVKKDKKKELEEKRKAKKDKEDLKEGDVFLEIDENMLRREIARMKRLREGDAQSMASHFGGGKLEDEMFVDMDDSDLNVNANNLGRNLKEGYNSGRQNRLLESKVRQQTQALAGMKKQLSEVNLFNAKLLYANKLMQNRDLTAAQQRHIVESLDQASNLREAKLLFEGLSKSLSRGTSRSSTLTEGAARRMTGGSSRSTLSAQSVETNRVEVDRWALLAGIKK